MLVIKNNDKVILTISDDDLKILADETSTDDLINEIERRIKWVITHKIELLQEELHKMWIPKIKQRMSNIPTNDAQLNAIIFSQPDYKDRLQRDTAIDPIINR